MSGVYQRNREVSEYKFFTQAIAIRVEVNKPVSYTHQTLPTTSSV